MTAGRIAALVAGRVGRSFWICQRKEGRDGLYDTAAEAGQAYVDAAQEFYGEFYNNET
jgi:hypothetical protein